MEPFFGFPIVFCLFSWWWSLWARRQFAAIQNRGFFFLLGAPRHVRYVVVPAYLTLSHFFRPRCILFFSQFIIAVAFWRSTSYPIHLCNLVCIWTDLLLSRQGGDTSARRRILLRISPQNCAVMSNMKHLAQLRKHCRPLYSDLAENTFPKLFDMLLSKENFLPEKGMDGVMMVVPMWSHCLICVKTTPQMTRFRDVQQARIMATG